MKISDTISVNPGKETLGHVENASSSVFRTPVLGAENSHHTIDVFKVLFPTAGTGSFELRKYEVPLRTIFATIMLVTGITILTSLTVGDGISLAVCSICFGAFLALGLFTRPLMLGAAVYYCIYGALALRGGTADMTVFSLMFGCLLFAVTGAGKYSCDTLIRHAIIKHRKLTEKRRKENMMSYKAFHQVKF